VNKRQLIINKILLLGCEFTIYDIRKRVNLSKNKNKSLSTNYIYRVVNSLISKKTLFIQGEKRKKKANNYPIKKYSINLELLNKIK